LHVKVNIVLIVHILAVIVKVIAVPVPVAVVAVVAVPDKGCDSAMEEFSGCHTSLTNIVGRRALPPSTSSLLVSRFLVSKGAWLDETESIVEARENTSS